VKITQHFCDRCKKEISNEIAETISLYKIYPMGGWENTPIDNSKDYVLCYKCLVGFVQLVNNLVCGSSTQYENTNEIMTKFLDEG
jgi:hypothetical protein